MLRPASFDLAVPPQWPASRPASLTNALMPTYAPLPVEFTHGHGAWLWDSRGRRYLDAVAGIGVTALGHAHPAVVEAIRDQAGKLLHVSNLYEDPWRRRLAQRLTALAGMEQAFFNNSGAEAVETALKLARRYAWQRGVAQPVVLVMDNGYHGRTLATLSASANPAVREGFGPYVEGFVSLPFGDESALQKASAAYGERIVAVLAEPVQGEGGVQPAPAGFLQALRRFCDQHACLLMLDEVQCGLGRTGRWFAFQHEGVQPDVVIVAKALANGIPIGACLARGPALGLLSPGRHGSTFGGNPLACRVACTVLDVIEREGLVAQAAQRGELLLLRLRQRLAGVSQVLSIRGHGLMLGIELATPCKPLALRALEEQRLLINVTRERVIRLLPPLVIDVEQVGMIADGLQRLLA